MMAGPTIWLEREVGTLIVQWLDRLTEWRPFESPPDDQVCLACFHYGAQLHLSETPHTMLHPLIGSVDDLVSNCFLIVAGERHAALVERGWTIAIRNGVVLVGTPASAVPPDGSEAPETTELSTHLNRLHTELLGRAIRIVGQHHADITAAVQATVEPVVRRMAAQLITEICEP